MIRRRRAFALPGLAVILGVLLWGYGGLPAFGARVPLYGRVIDALAESQRHVTNLVSAVMFDYRGVDTMVEEFILFAAVMGVALLLRSSREALGGHPGDVVASDALRLAGRALPPMAALFGLWVIAYGYVTPGGGFQGGVLASGGALLVWLAGSHGMLRRAAPTALVDAAEGLGAAAYVGVGLAGLATGAAFLDNVLPLGTAGTLASGGTIAALNWVAGVEVAGAFVLVYRELAEEYAQVPPPAGTAAASGEGG